MKRLIALFLFTNFSIYVSAQIAMLSIENMAVCAEQEVLIPVKGSQINNLAALSLHISYDTNSLRFIGVTNITQQLTELQFGLNMNPEANIGVAWSSLNPIQFTNNKLFDLKFYLKSLYSPVTFLPTCQLADLSLQSIEAVYSNGGVTNNVPVILNQPDNQKTVVGGNVSFDVEATCEQFKWQESRDGGTSWVTLQENSIYTGVTTAQLSIHNLAQSFNGYLYRCNVVSGNCSLNSEDALLTIEASNGLNDPEGSFLTTIKIIPNPIISMAGIQFKVTKTGKFSWILMDCLGNSIEKRESDIIHTGIQNLSFDLSYLKPGIYFYRSAFVTSDGTYGTTGKFIKRAE